MKNVLSLAKITPPRAEGIILRGRLFRLLDSGRRFPLTWVSGPPGSGKTMLLASYLHARRLPCLWYQVDEGDGDISTFFYYLGLAAKKISPKKKPLPLLTPEYGMGIPVFTRRYFEELYSRLALPPSPSRKRAFLIVFDNYQEVPANSGFHETIIHGLDSIPDRVRVIILSRSEPPSSFVRLQANHQVNFLGWNDLRFTPEETRHMVKAKGGTKLTEENLLALHKKSDGWAAGLMLLLISAKLRNFDYEAQLRSLPKQIMDYLSREVFERTDPATQQFLLKTAFLPSMTAGMAEKLTGAKTSAQILSYLSRNQYFTQERFPAPYVYQYHPLFREFLLSKAREAYSQDEIRTVQRSGAALLEEAGQMEDAAALFRDAGDCDGLAGLILHQAPSLLAQGRGRTLEEWVNGLPAKLLDQTAWLLYWLGMCRLPSNPAAAQSSFQRAFQLFQKDNDFAGTLLSWAGAVDTVIFHVHNPNMLDPWIEWMESLMLDERSFPSLEIEARVASGMVGALVWRNLHHPQIRKWVERSLSLMSETRDPNLRLQALSNAVLYYAWVGDIHKLPELAQEMEKLESSLDASPLMLLVYKYCEAMVCSSSPDRYERGIQAVEEGIGIAEKSGIHILDHFLLFLGSYNAFNIGDLERAGRYLRDAERKIQRDKQQIFGHYDFLLGWFDLLRGSISQALAHAEKTLKASVAIGSPFPQFLSRHLLSKALAKTGRYDDALAHLRLAKEWASRSGESNYFFYLVLLTEAELESARGNDAACLEALHRALSMGKRQQYRTLLFFWDRSAMARLCQKALTAGIEVDYVQDLIRSLKLFPDKPPVELENWPWPLKVYTLGKFEIIKDGKAFQFSGKAQKKPLLMLRTLIAQAGKEVKEEDIADWLWPDAEGDAAHSTFKSNLSRLRQLLGMEEAVRFQEGKASLDPRYCWVDAWAFERVYEQAEAVFRKKGTGGREKRRAGDHEKEEIMALAENAIHLYQGEFLPAEIEHPWTTSMRERLRHKYHVLIERMGSQLEAGGALEAAAEHYEKALLFDELDEEFFQRLMVCYLHLGRKVDAVKAYRRCRRALETTLGIEPSPKTEAIYKKILGAREAGQ